MPSIPIVPGGERDVVIDVTVKSDTRGAKEAAAALEGIDRAADKTAHSLDRTDRAADRTGKTLRRVSVDEHLLRDEITKTILKIEDLERTMLRTGDRSLVRQIRSERSFLASLRQIPKLSSGFTEESAFAGVSSARLGGVPLPGIIGGVTAVAALGPLLGGMVAGIVSGAIGTGGIAGGILMAAHDPKVQSAARQFADNISGEFSKGGAAFVTPILQSMSILNQAFRDMDLPGTFAKVAPTVTTIAGGLADLGRNIMPGLNKAFDRMGPFANVAAEGFSEMGSALGTFIDEVTASPGAIMALDATFKIINGTIIFIGKNLRFLADAFAGGLIIGEKITALLSKVPGLDKIYGPMHDMIQDLMSSNNQWRKQIDEFGSSADKAAGGFEDLGAAVAGAKQSMTEFFDSLTGTLNAQVSLGEANLAVEQGWADLTEAIRENGTSLDVTSQSGRDNQQAILDQIGRLVAQRDATIRVTGATSDASDAYQAQIEKLIGLGTQAGLSRDELEKLAGNYSVTVSFQADMSRWLNQFGYLLPGYGSTVTSFATGGTTPANKVFRVGENGPEYLFSDREHFVATGSQMTSAMSGGGSMSGGSVIQIDMRGGDDDLLRWLRKRIRVVGGTGSDSVQVALGN